MRGEGVTVSQWYIGGIIVGIMVIREFRTVIIIHVVERCMIIMIVRIVVTAAVAIATHQADTTHITVDVTMVTHQVVLPRDIHTREDVDHLLVRRDIIVTSTDHGEKTRKDQQKVTEDGDLVQQQEGRREDIITIVHVVIIVQ